MKALVVDDEVDARKLLHKLLEETMVFNEIILAESVSAAKGILSDFEPDLIFLDIKMPGKDGFTIAGELREKGSTVGIIFVTAYEQYALQAIKHSAFDYLLKPVNRKELKQCIIRFIEARKRNFINKTYKPAENPEKKSRIKVNTRTGTLFINPSQIIYCRADGNYTNICTGTKMQLCSMNLGKIAEQLPENGFIRVGRSYIVNYEYITVLDRKDCKVTLERDGEAVTIKIPKQYLKELDKF